MLSLLLHICISLLPAGTSPQPDPCKEIRASIATTSALAADSAFTRAVSLLIKAAQNNTEYGISFGKDQAGKIMASALVKGMTNSGTLPAISNPVADLHNHNNNLPPDAGDFFGLINCNRHTAAYKTRFVITNSGTIYALLITDLAAARAFIQQHPPQPPAYAGGPWGFSAAITDEGRQLKYLHNCSDEMVMAFILEKYSVGVCLLKQMPDGHFAKLITRENKEQNERGFTLLTCS